MQLSIATCQFPTSSDLLENSNQILRLMDDAADRGARVVHLPEACLPGYVPSDRESYANLSWRMLRELTEKIMDRAARRSVWVILGSVHKLTPPHKPHNSVYVIDDHGAIVDRYDKRYLSGAETEDTGELSTFTPGDHPSVFVVDGVKCGVLICYEYRFPELYRQYKLEGVQLVFHSYHAAHMSQEVVDEVSSRIGPESIPLNSGTTYPSIVMPPSMIAAAAANHVWISCSNSCAPISCWESFAVRADGVIEQSAESFTAAH